MSVLVATALDGMVGEPPPAAHPVVWTGRYLGVVAGAVPAGPPRRATARGGAAWLLGAAAAVAAAATVEAVARRSGPRAGVAVRGVALWPLLSARMLLTEVRAVEAALQQDLPGGRVALARIVSRETCDLTPAEVRGAAIASLAENLSDSVVAPLFWYAVGGLPAAALHRYANTADACWGYRTPRWEHAGRVAARVDDALNLAPARVTALLLTRPGAGLRAEARRTASPNAGWPMAAAALRLDLRLAKRGAYALNPAGVEPGPSDVDAALRLARRTVLLATGLAAAAEHLIRRARGGRP